MATMGNRGGRAFLPSRWQLAAACSKGGNSESLAHDTLGLRRLWAAALSSLSSGGRRLALSLSPLSSARSKTISPCLRSPAQGARQAASKTVAEGAVRRAGAGDGDGDSGSPIVVTDARQEVTVSQFVAQLDEAARRRLNSMHQATTEQPDLNKPKL
ncbi:uncharacterized protein [Zea mays]|uniref:uncharacterized protein n=1 Tax=Zea mays TaxID=4577 RepID=UPI0016532A94|nr:uncharacterized protein LOC118473425 [Zea mays]